MLYSSNSLRFDVVSLEVQIFELAFVTRRLECLVEPFDLVLNVSWKRCLGHDFMSI